LDTIIEHNLKNWHTAHGAYFDVILHIGTHADCNRVCEQLAPLRPVQGDSIPANGIYELPTRDV
jgi:hypothetical protein